jgi:hypothetical protein
MLGGKIDSASVLTSAWCFYQPPQVSLLDFITSITDVIECHLLLALQKRDPIQAPAKEFLAQAEPLLYSLEHNLHDCSSSVLLLRSQRDYRMAVHSIATFYAKASQMEISHTHKNTPLRELLAGP